MNVLNSMLANLDPKRYDRELPASEFDPVINLDEQEVGGYSIVHMEMPEGFRMEMTGYGGYVRFDADIILTKLLHGTTLWMTNSPSEIRDMENLVAGAKGTVLVAGLGIGIVPTLLSKLGEVTRVDVVELSPEVIEMVAPSLPEKVKVFNADFMEWMKGNDLGGYDFFILDIWSTMCSDDLPTQLDLWTACKRLSGKDKIEGGIWGLHVTTEDVLQDVRGYFYPSESAAKLEELGLADIAFWFDDNESDDNFDEADENGETEDWGDYVDTFFYDALEDIYNLRC